MLLHAFWWDVYNVFKKRETCAFLSHLIYNFTVYIVNNTASPYVEYSMKHFYFNHLVEILEEKKSRKQKVCFPLAMFCVSDHRGEFGVCWHRDGPHGELNVSYIVRDLWNLLPECSRGYIYYLLFKSNSLILCLFLKVFFLDHCSHCSMKKNKTNLKSSSYFVTKLF